MPFGNIDIPWSVIAALGVSGVLLITLYTEIIRPWREARKERKRERRLAEREAEIQKEAPELETKILWGPPGDRAQQVDEIELEANSTEFFYFWVKNVSDDKVYNVALEAQFPEGFEILKEDDENLNVSELGKTADFHTELVGEGGEISYRFLPSFGTLNPDPPQIRHNRRRAVTGAIPNRGPNDVGMYPFWIRTSEPGEYEIDVAWHVSQSDEEVGEVPLNDYEKTLRIVVGDINYI